MSWPSTTIRRRSRRCASASPTSRTCRRRRCARSRDRIRATTRYDDARDVDAILLCLPTPLTPNREPDLNALVERRLERRRRAARRASWSCSSRRPIPGTTRERLVPILEESGLKAGRDFDVAFSPERIDPGRTDHTMRTTPKVVGGLTEAERRPRRGALRAHLRRDRARRLAGGRPRWPSCWRTSSARSTSRSSTSCRSCATGWASTSGRSSTRPRPSPTGSCASIPGPGMGGHCLPVDPFYLTWKAREYDLATEFIELAGKVNAQMPMHCVQRIERALNDVAQARQRHEASCCSGMSYKAGIGDVRESPAIVDRRAPAEPARRAELPRPFVAEVPELGLRSVELAPAVEQAELVVILTAHPEVDHAARRRRRATRARLPRRHAARARPPGAAAPADLRRTRPRAARRPAGPRRAGSRCRPRRSGRRRSSAGRRRPSPR